MKMTQNIKSKTIVPIILLLLVVIGYFVYTGFFVSDEELLSNAGHGYVDATKLGRLVDILNKEAVSFNTNLDNQTLLDSQDFTIEIHPSERVGRSNPFLP